MPRARRVRRANPTDLYRTCKAAGTCPEDVINKVEGSTVADKILRYGSLGVFFGGLGISTGAGRGGRLGYTPLGGDPTGGVRVGGGGRVVRPPVPVDAVGPTDILPVDALDPSVVPLVDATDASVTLVEGAAEVPSGVPRVPPGGAGGAPVVTSDTSSSAVLEVAPEPSVSTRTTVSRSQFSNPAFEVTASSTNNYGETSGTNNIFVTRGSEGVGVGEEIPLAEFPRSSTPRDTPPPRPRRGGYPTRFIEHVPFDTVEGVLSYEYQNPAYDDSGLRLGPDEALERPADAQLGFTRLSSPKFSTSTTGRARVFRTGLRPSMTLRSGLRIGSQVHLYHDISDITEPEVIELQTIAETSSPSSVSSIDRAFEVIDLSSSDTVSLESGHHSSLADDSDIPLITGRLSFSVGPGAVPRTTLSLEVPIRGPLAIPPDNAWDGADVGVVVGPSRPVDASVPWTPLLPTRPPALGGFPGTDYYLHPGLSHRKRRKRRPFWFLL
ncbi:L2 [Ailuropoda melanoleuca papillomavirus 4]|uniref:Minor capsid protein L2 n=1 Tax=Ailuropoda melanoleuca papillomavirus 4 TaxID=2016453 RepID=A0A220IGG0_9PAPI|nr:L2 [Ailuropoda melanoleuca papillomavirus 4]